MEVQITAFPLEETKYSSEEPMCLLVDASFLLVRTSFLLNYFQKFYVFMRGNKVLVCEIDFSLVGAEIISKFRCFRLARKPGFFR